METLRIHGGAKLRGSVEVSGSKNAATKMMIAALLTEEPVVLHNCPQIGDVEITAEICEAVGAQVERSGSSLTVTAKEISSTRVRELSRGNRLSVLALSPLLHRVGHAEVPVVGGDLIGPRPVNWHLEGLRQMGAQISEEPGVYIAKAGKLRGTTVRMPYPSVGATENIILAAVLAKGRTVIYNAAIEPEVIDLIKLLQQMGAIIELGANRTIFIDGVRKLFGVEYTVMPDRLEAASWAMMAIATDGEVTVHGARQDDLITFLNTLRRVRAVYRISGDGMCFSRGPGSLRGTQIETDTHPGFATDWQQPLGVLMTQCEGRSVIHETVYEDRFGYMESLLAMGANVRVETKCIGGLKCRFAKQDHRHSAVIEGPSQLHGHRLIIPDIRAGMAHVIAALVAQGESELTGVEHLMRGYEHLLDKLKAVGANFSAH